MIQSSRVLVDPILREEELKAQKEGKAQPEAPSEVETSPAETNEPSTDDRIAALEARLQDKESFIGRQGNEIGAYRQLVDDLIGIKRDADLGTVQETKEISTDALLDNPRETITSIVRDVVQEALQPVSEKVDATAAEAEWAALNNDFEGWQEEVTTEPYAKWVSLDPARIALTEQATQGDIKAARSLLSGYRDAKVMARELAGLPAEEPAPKAENQPVSEKPQGLEGAREAKTEGNAPSGNLSPKKTYFADDIVKMINNDPVKYRSDAFQKELKEAIAEGRFVQ